MKQTILNLYNRDYFTFYLLISFLDTILLMIFKIPLLTLAILSFVTVLSLVSILKKFKK